LAQAFPLCVSGCLTFGGSVASFLGVDYIYFDFDFNANANKVDNCKFEA